MAGSLDSPPYPTEITQPVLPLGAADRLPILAVDDRRENLVALEAVLAPLGFAVVTAESGEEALRLLLEREFALIVLDVRMPGLDGIATTQLIKARERTREIPIVLLTAARDEVSDILRGYGAGAVDYVLKPFDAELLRSKVAVFAELEHSRRALRQSEALLRSAFEAAPIGKTLLDVERRIVRANPAFAHMIGRAQDALNGIPITQLCHAEDREALSAVLDRITADPDRNHTVDDLGSDVRLMTDAWREVWVSPTASSITGTDLTTPLLLVQWVDVGGRRRAEQARAELLLEQAARTQAEAQAERLEKLQRLVEALEPSSVEDLLAELARRVVSLFDGDAAEVQVNDGREAEAILSASEIPAQRRDPQLADRTGDRWQEFPLTAEGTAIGLLRIALRPGRSFTTSERALLRDAADRISLVLRRVQLHEQEHRIAVELQRGLLPIQLPELPGVAIAAHSQAAGLGAEVGGDWYDAFPLPGDRLGVVIGDVTGSGIRAASAMGQLRSVTRAFALSDSESELPTPAEVLNRLQHYHRKLGREEFFTILYVILDRRGGTLAWANAGHPPPLLRMTTGEVHTLHGAQSMMCFEDVSYEDRSAALGDGDTLILYTDGLVERRGEALDAGLERLAVAARGGPEEPHALSAALLRSASVRGAPPEDDFTVLVVRTGPSASSQGEVPEGGVAQAPIEITVPPDANAPAAARRLLDQAYRSHLDQDQLERAKLAISELATNAVRHGRGEITLRAQLNEARLLVEVIDQGSGFEPVAPERELELDGGWGLRIVDGDTSRWGMHEGTSHVWFEIERGSAGRREAAPA